MYFLLLINNNMESKKEEKDRIKTNNISKIIKKSFSCIDDPTSIKVFDKTIFSYPKHKKLKKMFWNNHNIINIELIEKLTDELLTESKYKGVKIIHPYLILLSWNYIKKYFVKKYCESTICYEINPKIEYADKLNYYTQTRETLKITSILITNNLFKNEFPDYYSYLIGEKGISIQENINTSQLKKTRQVDIKLFFDDKIYIFLKINDSQQKQTDYTRATEIFNKTGTMPILYYYDKQDMSNLIPKIYREFAYAISKVDINRALKFYLIIINNLNPIWVKFCVDNLNEEQIPISDITDILEIYGMKNKNMSKYIKKLIHSGVLDEDNITYKKNKVLQGYVSQIGCDIIFMRLENKYFSNQNDNYAAEMCKLYSIVKQKYFKTLKGLLTHQQKHFKTIYNNRNDIAKLYDDIKPINNIVHEMNYLFYDMISDETRKEIKKVIGIELHHTFMFLVKQENKFIDKQTFKKVTKADYQTAEETSSYICNHRWITDEEWGEVKELLEKKIIETETESETI